MSDAIIFKTTSGLDYIGVIEKETDTEFHINDMYAVVPQQSGTGEVNVSFGAAVHPAIGAVNNRKHGSIDKVKLQKTAVIFTHEPNQQLTDAYTEATCGIQIARTLPGNL